MDLAPLPPLVPLPTDAPLWVAYGVPCTKGNQPICNADAALRVLECDLSLRDTIWFDTFLHRIYSTWSLPEGTPARAWQDHDGQRLLIFLQREIGLSKMSKSAVEDALAVFVQSHRKHVVREWLTTLTWDATPRIASCLTALFGAPDTPYVHAASRNFWLSLMARVMRPGCQVDHMLVLEGPQGQGKTSALRTLGGAWYLAMNESVMTKDFFQLLPGTLIVEIAELDSFQRAELTRIKQAISTPSDTYRASYGRLPQTYTRQCVFVGTTNELHYLRDMTGSRRFWPIPCGVIDLPALTAQREQLFAEALAQYKAGDPWWTMPADTLAEQEARREEDAWEAPLRGFLLDRIEVTVADVLCDGLKMPLSQIRRSEQQRAAAILRKLGWERVTVRHGDQYVKRWRPKDRQPGEDAEIDFHA